MLERLLSFFGHVAGRTTSPNEGDGLPLPPANLLMQAAGSPAPDAYLQGGQLAEKAIRQALSRNHATLSGTVLDFGCGCGRVLRRWYRETGVEWHGCDYNAELALWSREHLPFARIAVNSLLPPAPYRDGRFSLIYALSVLTHLPEEAQSKWIREFHRLLAPGGVLIVTTHGEHYLARLNGAEQRRFQGNELVVRSARSAGSNLCNAFHPPLYFRERLSRGFEVLEHVPKGALGNAEQDLWVLRKAE